MFYYISPIVKEVLIMKRSFVALCLSALLIVVFSIGCAAKPVTEQDFVGIYKGSAGSVIELRTDGTAHYVKPDGTNSGDGPWSYKDGTIVLMPFNLGYEIYANIDPESCEIPSLLFKSDQDCWKNETFTKKP